MDVQLVVIQLGATAAAGVQEATAVEGVLLLVQVVAVVPLVPGVQVGTGVGPDRMFCVQAVVTPLVVPEVQAATVVTTGVDCVQVVVTQLLSAVPAPPVQLATFVGGVLLVLQAVAT